MTLQTSNTPTTAEDILMQVDAGGKKAIDWAAEYQEEIEARLVRDGALLIRGLNILSSKQFGKLLEAMFGAPLINYSFRSTPRTELRGNVYTATEYHPSEVIPQHNENAYTNSWPLRIGFLCMVPSETGGETPLADSRLVYDQIPAEIREEFDRKKVLYVRNYGDIDLPWSEVFQTEDKSEVEQYCRDNGLDFEWLDDLRLRTKQINQATIKHPSTKENLWFNQAHLFHVSSLEKEARENLLSIMDEEDLPRNTYYGDGTPIGTDELNIIRKAYEDIQFSFTWEKNDFLLLDNMLFTHGRRPFSGDRKVLVGMAKPMSTTV